MIAATYAGPRRVLSIRWGRDRGPVESARPQASHPATVDGVPMPNADRAALGGQARAEKLPPERRREIAEAASRKARSAPTRARQLANAWDDADDDERREARKILRDKGIAR